MTENAPDFQLRTGERVLRPVGDFRRVTRLSAHLLERPCTLVGIPPSLLFSLCVSPLATFPPLCVSPLATFPPLCVSPLATSPPLCVSPLADSLCVDFRHDVGQRSFVRGTWVVNMLFWVVRATDPIERICGCISSGEFFW